MADTAVATPTKVPKKKTPAKPKKPSDHPKYSEMVGKAISALKERGGSSRLCRDSSAVRWLFVRLAGAVGRQSALHKENSGFAAQIWVGTFPRFVLLKIN